MDSFTATRNKRAFRAAQKAAHRSSELTNSPHMVCGFIDNNGVAQYVSVPRDFSDEQVAETVFMAKHGRPMNDAEKLLAMAARGELVRQAEGLIEHYYENREVADAS